jgi:hypothetical protein
MRDGLPPSHHLLSNPSLLSPAVPRAASSIVAIFGGFGGGEIISSSQLVIAIDPFIRTQASTSLLLNQRAENWPPSQWVAP